VSLDDIEYVSEGRVIACRYMRLGLWAGTRLGLRGERLADYARAIMAEDYRLPGPDDVIEKIRNDFAAHGVAFPQDAVSKELQRIERQVRTELIATD
jgi:hypothetical protein